MPTPSSTTPPTAAHYSDTKCTTYGDDMIFVGFLHEISVNDAALHTTERTTHHHNHRPIYIASNIRKAFDSVSLAILNDYGIINQPRASSSNVPSKLPPPSKLEEVD